MFSYAPSKVKPVPPIGVPFAPIPLDVMKRKDLSPSSKLVFAAIANQARMRRGDSTLTNAQIADATGTSEAAVRRALAELESVGMIQRQFGASERVRTSIRVTYDPDEVAQGRSTPPLVVAQPEQPGCAPAPKGVAQGRATPLSKNEESSKNADVSLVRGGEDQSEPRPSPAEIAEGLRAMIAGEYAPVVWPSEPSTQSPPPPAPPDLRQTPTGRTPAPPRDVHDLARGIFVDARRAAYAKPGGRPKTAEQQLAELKRWSAGRST
jgi:hypothetical protein